MGPGRASARSKDGHGTGGSRIPITPEPTAQASAPALGTETLQTGSEPLGKGKKHECLKNASFPLAWGFEPLVADGDEVLNQGRALGISCSWETLGALGGEEQGPPMAPAQRMGENTGQTHRGEGPWGWGGGNWD